MKNIFNLFKTSDTERKLENNYVPLLVTNFQIPKRQAQKTLKKIINKAKEQAAQEGTSDLPSDYGESLLKNENSDVNLKRQLKAIREEGVTNDDIKFWWNMNDLERRVGTLIEDFFRAQLFYFFTLNKMEEEKAHAQIKKTHPLYGDVSVPWDGDKHDKPLPFELKERINLFIIKNSREGAEDFHKELLEYSSFNAFLREKIKQGLL
jgi:hypothetical protein